MYLILFIGIAILSYVVYNPQNDFSALSKTKRQKSGKNPKTKRFSKNQSHNLKKSKECSNQTAFFAYKLTGKKY